VHSFPIFPFPKLPIKYIFFLFNLFIAQSSVDIERCMRLPRVARNISWAWAAQWFERIDVAFLRLRVTISARNSHGEDVSPAPEMAGRLSFRSHQPACYTLSAFHDISRTQRFQHAAAQTFQLLTETNGRFGEPRIQR